MTGVEGHTALDQGDEMIDVTALPTYDEQTQDDLITQASRLAFQAEAAGERGDFRAEARLRMQYHAAQAELLARTTAWCDEAQARNEQTRRQHLCSAQHYRWELEQLTSNDPEKE